MKRSRLQVVKAVVGIVAVMAAGCGSQAGLSPVAPTVGFSAGLIEIAPADVEVGTLVNFECLRATDPSGGSLSYSWDFGDGATGSGEATTHAYSTNGVFMVTVTVHSSEAGSTQTTLNVPVGRVPRQ
jgi:chitinase